MYHHSTAPSRASTTARPVKKAMMAEAPRVYVFLIDTKWKCRATLLISWVDSGSHNDFSR